MVEIGRGDGSVAAFVAFRHVLSRNVGLLTPTLGTCGDVRDLCFGGGANGWFFRGGGGIPHRGKVTVLPGPEIINPQVINLPVCLAEAEPRVQALELVSKCFPHLEVKILPVDWLLVLEEAQPVGVQISSNSVFNAWRYIVTVFVFHVCADNRRLRIMLG